MRAWLQQDGARLALTAAASLVAVAGLVACGAASVALSAPEIGPQQRSGAAPAVDTKNARIAPSTPPSRCPTGMALVADRFCVDRWEASLVEVGARGEEQPHSPFVPIGKARVRAVSAPGVFPQAYVSAVEAKAACAASSKRLCKPAEWRAACVGASRRAYGYGDAREGGRCNDSGRHPAIALFGRRSWSWGEMNSPLLNQLPSSLGKTGERAGCTNDLGVYDMVGNLHEWVDDPAGTFNGGYYLDVTMNGEGCGYSTTAHGPRYHDYSTGFRCCADAAP
ncbi:MAG: SUMF1/EgtB/PvdO family nonheme iron enzyme [Myxococcales bacterium]|jgi:hypothetical protein|nr:SUMF1/EgtB/PvdO family nonheme iron enzyme [Myxococcales bacterium]